MLGVELDDVTVNVEHDTQKDPWSIAAGNYSSRFSGAVAGAAHLAAMKLRERLARIASTGLNATPEALVFAGGRIFAADNPENAIPLRRAAGIAHWSPGSLPEHAEPGLRETIFWSMPGLDPPYVFVSHDLATVQGLCDRVAVLYLGRIVEQGPADEVLQRPCHSLYPGAGRRRVDTVQPPDRGRDAIEARPR